MAQQEEPLYDFPEPTQPSQRKALGHQRGRGSLRSISVLDRLLLTVPVWFQLSVNPATALHILQREPPGTFLVRKSRTSQRNVLLVRLADDSVPSFVQEFGIREEHCTLSLETSAISFPDLPRLISFYCVSRDVLPFPLELPEAIAKATSHKELESISHMGIEFWSSHLNVRGPRETPKPQKDKEKLPDIVASASPDVPPQTSSESAPQPDSDSQLKTVPESDTAAKQSGPGPTLFHEFCPITTRSPRELDCGSGMGALCFINPLFLQSQDTLSRQRMFKRSLKVRVSTETSTLLSPPLSPPPPPPLMPKTKGKCQFQKQGQGDAQSSKGPSLSQGETPGQATQSDITAQDTHTQDSESQMQLPSTAPHFKSEIQECGQTQIEPGQTQAAVEGVEAAALLPAVVEHFPDDSDYMQPSPMINFSHSPSLSPYLSPTGALMAPPLSPHNSISVSPSLSPYQSPSLSPKVPFSLSPCDSPSASPSLSPYQSPSPSPKGPCSLSPFTPLPFPHTHATASKPNQQGSERATEEEGVDADENKDEDSESNEGLREKGEEGEDEKEKDLVLQMKMSLEGAVETPPLTPH